MILDDSCLRMFLLDDFARLFRNVTRHCVKRVEGSTKPNLLFDRVVTLSVPDTGISGHFLTYLETILSRTNAYLFHVFRNRDIDWNQIFKFFKFSLLVRKLVKHYVPNRQTRPALFAAHQ